MWDQTQFREEPWELINQHSTMVTTHHGQQHLDFYVTSGQPYPWVTDGRTGKYGWHPEDPAGIVGHIYITYVWASVDENGEPDMTTERKVVDITSEYAE